MRRADRCMVALPREIASKKFRKFQIRVPLLNLIEIPKNRKHENTNTNLSVVAVIILNLISGFVISQFRVSLLIDVRFFLSTNTMPAPAIRGRHVASLAEHQD